MSFSGSVPEQYAFLRTLATSFHALQGTTLEPLTHFDLELRYSSNHINIIEWDDTTAKIYLDVRFIEAVVDLVSSLRLADDQECATRAFLVLYRLALDIALSADDDKIVAGMAQDYVVSRSTTDVYVPNAVDPEIDFSGDDLQAIAEKVALFVCAHEITHWLLDRDERFRNRAKERMRTLLSNIVKHADAADAQFQSMFKAMWAELQDERAGETLSSIVEEWICDVTAAESIMAAVATASTRTSAEVSLIAANIMLWARSRLRRMLDQSTIDGDLDQVFALERGSLTMFAVFALTYKEWAGSSEPPPTFPAAERLTAIATQAIVEFLDGRNIARLRAIGTVSLAFRLTTTSQAREALAIMCDWTRSPHPTSGSIGCRIADATGAG